MQHRIVLLGTSPDEAAQLQSALADRNAHATLCGPDQAPPSHVSAIVCTASPLNALNSLLAVSARNNAVLVLLADAIDAREDIPGGSAERVCRTSLEIGQALGLGVDELSVLERGALLRGIGKLKVPNAILLKQSLLDYDDWLLLQSHTTLGADLLRERGVCADVTDIVQCYHECWDGTGYPNGLEGKAIPRLARIVRVADVYCAMTSPRAYRKTHVNAEEALAHVVSERGKHFDPEIVDVFAGLTRP